MAFTVTLVERDETVGNPDARVVRTYPIATVDNPSHAFDIAAEHEAMLTGTRRESHGNPGTVVEFWSTLIDRKHPLEYGNVIRTQYISVGTR